jgi:U3 small nucleolar RNA-associated protein 20
VPDAESRQDDPESDASDDEDDTAEETAMTEGSSRQNGLSWLMSRLSFIARRLIIKKPSAAELIAQPVSMGALRCRQAELPG